MKDHAALRQCERCGDTIPDSVPPFCNYKYIFLCETCAGKEKTEAATVLAESGANPSHAVLSAEVARLREQVRVLRAAAEKFVNKCDLGLARSNESYAEFKAALEATKL